MADRCELCRYWSATSSTQSKAECEKTGKMTYYNDDCNCVKFSRG